MKQKLKSFLGDFKKFISKGNIIDLAVAVIVGGAFGKIVTSLVNDIIMPLITAAIGVNSISEMSLVIKEAVMDNGEVVRPALTLNWGSFLQNIIDFLIISFFIFLLIRALTAAKSVAGKLAEEAKEAAEKLAAEAKERIMKKNGSENETSEGQITEAEAVVTASEEGAEAAAVALETSTAEGEKAPGDAQSIEALLKEIRDILKKN